VKVEVVRSPRRRKTVEARVVDDVLRVSIPATMTRAEERRWVEEMLGRAQRQAAAEQVELTRRARELATLYRLPRPRRARWVDNQRQRWASCTPADHSIRVSNRAAAFPGWVVDYLVVHELAHLVEPGHGQRFWNLVNRYPLAERARGFLLAKEG
jgi:hypothetical protein